MNSYCLKTNNKLKVNTISESLSGYISYYIVRGLKHLFDLNVIHLDIKPENLLINSKNDILITDFTISEKFAYLQFLRCRKKTFLAKGRNTIIKNK